VSYRDSTQARSHALPRRNARPTRQKQLIEGHRTQGRKQALNTLSAAFKAVSPNRAI